MTDKKKQHFVPRCYLKRFSCNQDNKSINIYNFKAAKFITHARLYDQCHKDYYYGKDGRLEDVFANIEGITAKIINKIIATDRLPDRGSAAHHSLVTFIISQIARTESAEHEINESCEKLIKNIASKDRKMQELLDRGLTLDDIHVKLTQPMQMLFRGVVHSMPLALDLNYKLLINTTNTGFITSDNPVVKYNQFFEHRKRWGSNTGIATMGLQLFIPLNAQKCLLLYDEKIYRVGNKRAAFAIISDKESVEQINALQVVNCLNNLYSDQTISESSVRAVVHKYTPYRSEEKAVLREYEQESVGNCKSSLLHTFYPDKKINLQVMGITVLTSKKSFVMDDRAVYLRNPQLVEVHREFMGKVEKGLYQFSEFTKYLAEMKAIEESS